jgi:hypothetical protein
MKTQNSSFSSFTFCLQISIYRYLSSLVVVFFFLVSSLTQEQKKKL